MRRDDLNHVSPSDRLRWHEFGDESYGFAVAGKEPGAIYEWRFGNVVLIAQADCGGVNCRFDDVVPVTHAYVSVLDAHARRTS
jgi:hypothetical protein